MRKFALIAVAALTLFGCATPQQTVGTSTGVVAGAAVGGPVGAVVGGAVGATATAPGTPLGGPAPAGYCYVTDRAGRVIVDRRGVARLRRC
jgi:osmotically inducible lipoprotein OsmB